MSLALITLAAVRRRSHAFSCRFASRSTLELRSFSAWSSFPPSLRRASRASIALSIWEASVACATSSNSFRAVSRKSEVSRAAALSAAYRTTTSRRAMVSRSSRRPGSDLESS